MTTIAIIGCGAMGSAVGRRLTSRGATVLTNLEGRGPASRARAEAAGMADASDAEICARADLILSIVPPAEALGAAGGLVHRISASGRRPTFVDLNAVGVPTMKAIAERVGSAGAGVVDGAIIGFPPKGDAPGPTFHFSGTDAAAAMALGDYGLRVALLDGPVGAASAFKLSYAGITKGLVAVASAMILAAEREGAGPALLAELTSSQPQLLERFRTTLPDMFPKAARWVDEMRSISDFVGRDLPESLIHEGAAGLFERIGDENAAGGGPDMRAIERFLAGGA